MNSQPLISVIVPVYNTEKYIQECINSILKQTYQNIECILVDDGSTDGSPFILDENTTRDTRIRVIHKTNGGVISARKEGVQCAKGDYIYFIDSDDTIELDAIELIVNEINGEHDMILFEKSKNRLLDKEEYVAGLLTREISWSNCGNLYKRDLFEEYTFCTPRYFNVGEDFLTALRIAKNIKGKIITKNTHKYNYRICSNSAMARYEHTLEYELNVLSEVNTILKELNVNVRDARFHYNTMMLGGFIGLGLLKEFNQEWISDIVKESRSLPMTIRQRITIMATQNKLFQYLLIAERTLKEFARKLLGRR